MIDPNRLARLFLDEWQDTEQPIEQRGTILPLGIYEDGSAHLAVPGLIQDGIEGWNALWDDAQAAREGAYPTFDVEQGKRSAGNSLMAAGLAATGGLAAGAAGGLPDNALASNAVRMSNPDLPMDLASRMARAREMGFDLPAYHATTADFSEFRPGYRKASFFSDDSAAAERGAGGGSLDWYGGRGSPDRIMPVMLRSEYIKGLNLTPIEKQWWESLPNSTADEAFIEGLSYPSHNLNRWWQVYDETPNKDGTFTYSKKQMPSKTLDDVRKSGEDVYGSKYLGTYEGEQGAARLAIEDGMDGFILNDEAGISIGIADPRRIRSVNAAFDPAKADSANLLAANPKTSALAPAIVNALEDQAPKGIRAYHGSPHDFDRFDMSKIGTGEGAQAYGHGLYFAENEGVARSYRDTLKANTRRGAESLDASATALADAVGASGRIVTEPIGGNLFGVYEVGPSRFLKSARRRMIGTVEETEHSISGAKKYYAHSNEPGALDRLENPGRMYEVNINADPEDFLDWDLPLAQQSEKVRAILDTLGPVGGETGSPYLTETTKLLHQLMARKNPGNTSGEFDAAARAVSRELADLGIPGIRYKDAMSRGGDGGTNNYVVFDDALVEILRKYANPPTAATVPLGLSGQDRSDDDFLSALLSRYGVSN